MQRRDRARGAPRPRGSAPGESVLDGVPGDERLAGLDPEVLAERFGTPLYVYDFDIVARRVAALRAALPPAVELAYAVKANPALALVAHLGGLGLGADVASGGELATALRAGIVPGSIVMTGPGKRDAELAAAVAAGGAGIRAVTVESPGELARLEGIAAAAGRRVAVLLRASMTGAHGSERVRLIGDAGAGKFGMDPDDLRAAARLAGRSAHLRFLGVHRFGASNVLDSRLLAEHVAETVEIGRDVAAAAGAPLRLVDAGGGLGIPYADDEAPLDLAAFGRQLGQIAAGWTDAADTRDLRLLLEPGRYLAGPAGAYLARVVDRKRIGDCDVAILDGGVHHLLRPALVGQAHRVRVLGSRGAAAATWPVTLAGPLCSGLDVLAARAALPAPEPGDLVAVLDAGAYGFTESMPYFLSHAIPAEVAVRNGRAEVIRPRVEPGEWLERQVIPAW